MTLRDAQNPSVRGIFSTIAERTGGPSLEIGCVDHAKIELEQSALPREETVPDFLLSTDFNTKSNFNREFPRGAEANPIDRLQTIQTATR